MIRARPTLIGRSSSHFTRVARVFAAELAVECEFAIVRDLLSTDPDDYGGHPGLKIPSLRTARGVWFGSLNVCRELARLSPGNARVVWPEQLDPPLLANAQELVIQAMSAEVSLIMAGLAARDGGGAPPAKLAASLGQVMAWLERHAADIVAALPKERDLSYLEVALFCLVTHLEFRSVLPVAPYPALRAFCERFAERESARTTEYRFDP